VSAETVAKISLSESFPDFTTASVIKNPDVVAKYAAIHPDFLSMRVEALDLAIGHYRPLIPEWPSLGQAIGESVNAAINGLMTPEVALEQAEADMRDILGQ
jgi:maltose-binding protein MalE